MAENRKPDYATWIPRKMLTGLALAGGILAALFALSFLLPGNAGVIVLRVLLAVLAAFSLLLFGYMARARSLLAYDGGGVQGKILDNVLKYLHWDGNGRLLDIGCGSGALAVKAAKKFPKAQIIGLDEWGAMWDFAKSQCEENAHLEGVADRTSFQKGDAAHLAFPDASYDAAVSNFVFHEVRSEPDKLKLIREALRVLRPGAPFSFEDAFYSKAHYPDLNALLAALSKDVAELHFVDTRQNDFVPKLLKTPMIVGEMGLIHGRK